jgi:CheY-like chemotaxis protein
MMSNRYISDIYKTLNILCVEDDENVLNIYRDLFSLIFQKVYFARDGIEGFEVFEKEDIDIILTDHQMPRANGLQMSKKIREVDASIPIVMVTALESVDMLREALDLHITSFLKKPFTSASLFATFNLAVKSVIVDRCILKEQTEKLHYSHYQENLTYDKEKIVTKNDTYESQKLLDFNCELFYKPLDILSGDSYIIRKINDEKYLVFLVDGMGKGISASVTAMMCSSFVNYYIDIIQQNQLLFSLESLLQEFLKYIQPNLLEYEVVSATFLFFNKTDELLQYSIFSMPPSLYMCSQDDTVYKIKSNNIPLAPYTTSYNIDTLKLGNIEKMLIYSDGLNECTLKNKKELYGTYLKEDFKNAQNKQEFQEIYSKKILTQEDDTTYVFMHKSKVIQ